MSKTQTPRKSPPIDLNDKYDKADVVGTLIVVLLKARNLNDKHSFRKSDVFAQAILNGTQKRTHIDTKGGQHPEWDGEARFPILKKSGEKFRKMEVSCYSMEPRSEDLMGKGTVDISETLRTGEFDDWVQLEVDGVPRGELYIEMTYYANTPAPTPVVPNKLLSTVSNQNAGLMRRPSKLSPAERLSRPQQQSNTPVNQGPAQAQTHNSRLSEGHTPTRHDTPIMPGSYPSSSNSNLSGAPQDLATKQKNGTPYVGEQAVPSFKTGAQGQQPEILPSILRPGLPNSSSPILPHKLEHGRHPSADFSPPDPRTLNHRPQIGIQHGRHSSSDSSFPDNARHTKSGSSDYNLYAGGGESSSTASSQPSSPPRNPYMSNYVAPTSPYIAATGTFVEGQRPNNVPPNAAGRAQDVYATYRLGTQPRGGTPLLWQQENKNGSQIFQNGSFSFPKPDVPPSYIENTRLTHTRGPSGSYVPVNSGYVASTNDRNFEPHLQARYQSPLPLPPPPDHLVASAVQPQHPASQDSMLEASRNHIYTKAPTPPPKVVAPSLDQSRLDALRRAEEEASRRRAQELKDMELALQLDRELNTAEQRTAAR